MSELHKKLSCVPVSFFKDIISGNMSFYELALFCKKQGLSAVDLGVTLLGDRKETSLIDIRNQVEEAGVTIAGIMAYPDFTNPEEKKRINEIDNLERDLEAASTLGAKFVRITAGQSHKGLRRERGISLAVNGILEAISLSKHYNMRLLYEHHAKPSVWEYPDFNLPTDIFLEIFGAIKNSDIGVLFDTANPLVYGDDPFTILNVVYDRVECVHISDIKTKGKQEMVVIGTGIVPILDIMLFLQKNKYDGWISIEEASFTGIEGFEQAISFVRENWKQI
jgi:sugar phosphate isomerase/epimerase